MIIGNGFDLAHKLPTKYSDFINYYWSKIADSDHEDQFYKIHPGYNLTNCRNLRETRDYLERSRPGSTLLEIKSSFFNKLNEHYDDVNWVDIEIEYYKTLKDILQRNRGNNSRYGFEIESTNQVRKLNIEVAQIRDEFANYLRSNVTPKIGNQRFYVDAFQDLFSNDESTKSEVEKFLKEFSSKFQTEFLRNRYEELMTETSLVKLYFNTCILNFNYTPTFKQYLNSGTMHSIINIHGEMNDMHNPINLGFGDETDHFYKEIEDLNDNEYLKFMKSFQYSKNNRYKRLFDFVESDYFQVQILGHSCGLSDRTLLKAIFEHENCKSIKIFYHGNSRENNHTELVTNISRHFSDKISMRSKVVDESLCRELPQNSIN